MAQLVEQPIRNQQVKGSSPFIGSYPRGVAQFGSAFGSGPKGRGFESRHFVTEIRSALYGCFGFLLSGMMEFGSADLERPWGKGSMTAGGGNFIESFLNR